MTKSLVKKNPYTQATAIALVAALIVTAPGLPLYEACAAGIIEAPVSVTLGGPAGAMPVGAVRPGFTNSGNLNGVRFGGNLSGARSNGLQYKGMAAGSIEGSATSESAAPAVKFNEQIGSTIEQVQQAAESLSSIESISEGEVYSAGEKSIEAVTRARSYEGASGAAVAVAAQAGSKPSAFKFSTIKRGPSTSLRASNAASAPVSAPKSAGSKAVAVLKSVGAMGAGAAVVIGAQIAGAMLMPGAFGLVGYTAAWMLVNTVAVGVIWNPIKMRVKLAKSEAQGIGVARTAVDVAIGMVLGGAFVSGSVLGMTGLTQIPALLAGTPGMVFQGLVDMMAGVATTGVISPAPLLGMAGLAVLAHATELLPQITGKTKPSSRLAAFVERGTFLFIGIPYALASGFVSPGKILTFAFVAWNFSMSKPIINKVLNVLYVGGWIYAGFMGFATPITFLLIAFTADRAIVLMDYIIGKNADMPGQGKVGAGDDYMFRRKITHPPTGERIKRLLDPVITPEAKDPFKYKLKTALMMGGMVSIAAAVGFFLTGFSALMVPLAIMGTLMGVIAWFSHKIAVMAQGGVPYKTAPAEHQARLAELHRRMDVLAKKAGLPTPEFFFVPREKFPAPNAFATGFSPKRAAVAVTEVAMDIWTDDQIEGVLAHELMHVQHRDIILGSIMGAIGSAIGWAVYSIMYQVTVRQKPGVMTPRLDSATDVTGPGKSFDSAQDKQQTQMLPVAGVGPFTGPLLRALAAIYVRVVTQLLQMGHTRNREFYADQDGAILIGSGEKLVSAFRVMEKWRPAQLTELQRLRLPLIFAMDRYMFVSPIEQFLGREPETPVAGKPVSGVEADAKGFDAAQPKPVSEADYERAAGMDSGLRPVAKAMETMVGSRQEYGHLSQTLAAMLAAGGAVKYGQATVMTQQGPVGLPGAYDSASNTLIISESFRRVDPKLVAVILGSQLQSAYDSKNNRLTPIQETQNRQMKVVAALLETLDLKAMGATLDINNPSTVQLFLGLSQQRMKQLQDQYNPQPGGAQQAPNAAAYLKALQENIAGVTAQLKDLQDQLGLVEDNLTQKAGDEGLQKDKRILAEKIEHMKGTLYLAQQRLFAFMKEEPNKLALANGAAARVESLPTIKIAGSNVDEKLAPALDALRRRIAEDPIKQEKLAGVLRAIDRIIAEGGRISFGPTPEGAAAYFSPVSLDLIMSQRYEKAHPVLVAAVLAHEGTHADDYFSGRAMTRETEYGAFTNEGLYMEGVNANDLAHEIVPGDGREINLEEVNLYHHVMHVRRTYSEGKISLEAMVSHSYTQQVWTNLAGLLTAGQLLEELKTRKLGPVQQGLADLKRRIELIEGASAAKRGGREDQLEFLKKVAATYEAMYAVFERQKAQYEAAIKDRGDEGTPPATPASGVGLQGPGIPDVLGPLGPMTFTHNTGIDHGHDALLPPAPKEANAAPGTQASRGGVVSRAWQRIVNAFRISEDRSRNRSFWVWLVGQTAIVLGFELSAVAQPSLVGSDPTKQSRLGAVTQAASAISSFATGPMANRGSTKGMLVGTGYLRSFLLTLPAFLYFAGYFNFTSLVSIMAATAFVQVLSINLSKISLLKILKGDEASFTRAYAIAKMVTNVVSIFGPLMGGAFMGWADTWILAQYGVAHAGAVLTVGLYGLLAGVSALLYQLYLKVPQDRSPVLEARAQADGADGTYKQAFKGRVKEFIEGFGLIWSNRFLRRSFMLDAVENTLIAPLIYLSLPLLAKSLAAGAGVAGFGEVPVIGGFLNAVATTSGSYGLLLSAGSLGMAMSAGMMLGMPALVRWAENASGWRAVLAAPLRLILKLTRRIPGTSLERQGTLAYWSAAIAHFSFWGLLVVGSPLAAAGVFLAICVLDGPEAVLSDSLLTKVLSGGDGSLQEKRGLIISTQQFANIVLSIGGLILIGTVLGAENLILSNILMMAAVGSTVAGLIHLVRHKLVFPLEPKNGEKH